LRAGTASRWVSLAVRGAASYKVAPTRAGVGDTTFWRWMARGRAERDRLAAVQTKLERSGQARAGTR
jgi:hypothetical protein